MASINVCISGTFAAADLTVGWNQDPRDNAKRLAKILTAIANGTYTGTLTVSPSSSDAVAASSEVTATTSGSLGTVVNGTTVTTAFATSQDVTATNAVADVNANTTVNKLVTATKSGTGKFILTAKVPGYIGNGCTVTVTGTGASATGSGKLTGGVGGDGTVATYTMG